MLAVQAGLTLSWAAWHSVSVASSGLTQHAVIGSESANADGNNTNHRNFYRFSPFRQILSLSALFLLDVEKRIERDGKQQQENKNKKMGM